jgi:hypothetical protein
MGFHLLAYTKLDTAGASNEDIPAVTDNFATVQNNHYILQQDTTLLAAYVRNAGFTNARLNTPDFRRVSIPSIQPGNVNAAPITLSPMVFFPPSRLRIPKIDEIALEASNSGGGGVRTIGGVWVASMDHNYNVPAGDVYTLRFTSTITAVANAWTLGGMTFDQTLPAGNYAVTGLDVIGATTEFARLAFLGGGMRPGVIVRPAVSNYMWDHFRFGNVGLYGTFASTAIPNLEVFGTAAAGITYTGYMEVVKVG